MSKKLCLPAKTLFLLSAVAGMSLPVFGKEDKDMLFTDRLNEKQLYDYAELFLNQLEKKPGVDKENVTFLRLKTYILQNARREAAIGLLKNLTGTNLARAQGLVGLYYAPRNLKESLKYFEPMRKYVMDPKNGQKADAWEKEMSILFSVYTNLGMSKESQAIIEWKQQAEGDKAGTDREKLYQKALVKMEAINNAREIEKQAIADFQDAVKVVNEKGTDADKATLNAKVAELQHLNALEGSFRTICLEIRPILKKYNPDYDVAAYEKYLSREARAVTRAQKFAHRSRITDKNELKRLRTEDPDDWHTILIDAMFDLEQIPWGGQDVLTVSATALTLRGYYMLGLYEEAIADVQKTQELFDACDKALAEEGKLEESPGLDARMWEAYCNLGLAKQYEFKGDKKNALSYYKRAFKRFGLLLKKCPKHKDATKNYTEFLNVVDKISEMDPSLKKKMEEQIAKVPMPEAPAEKSVSDKAKKALVSSVTEENFRQKNYQRVVEELKPAFLENLGNDAEIPKVLNMLIISLVLQEDPDNLSALALAQWMASKHRDNELTVHALKTCGSLIWQQQQKLSKAEKTADQAKVVAQLKSDAMQFYSMYLTLPGGVSDQDAADVALRCAREHYNRTNAFGKQLNAANDEEVRAALKQKWMVESDLAIQCYRFITNNFGNKKQHVDEGFLKMAEIYINTNRYEDAAQAYLDFCKRGSDDKVGLIKAKENAAEAYYRVGVDHMNASRKYRADADAIEINTSADAAQTEDKEQEVLKQKKAALEAKADEEEKIAKEFHNKAIANMTELLVKWFADGSEFAKFKKDPAVQKTINRGSSVLPWLYDSIGDKEKAIEYFDKYIKQNPKDPAIPAYMMRIGMLYTESGKDTQAQEILTRLTKEFPESQEGKNAKFFLAKNLFENNSYAKAMPIIKEIFESDLKNNLTITNLRWVADKLMACPVSSLKKDAAAIALQADTMLLEKLKNPVLKDWVGGDTLVEFAKDKDKLNAFINQMGQKMNLDSGFACMILEKYDDAVKYFDYVYQLDNNTPYYNKLFFARAEALSKLGKYDAAKKDLQKIGSRALQRGRGKSTDYATYNKAQVLIGEVFLKEKKLKPAYAMFSSVGLPAYMSEAQTPVKSDDPENDTASYVEQAIYRTAYTAARLGRQKEKKDMVEKYRRYYPSGRFQVEMSNLPDVD